MIKYNNLTTCRLLTPTEFWSSNECGIRAISYIVKKLVSAIKSIIKKPEDISIKLIYLNFGIYLLKTNNFNIFDLSKCTTTVNDIVKHLPNNDVILGLIPDENDYNIVRKNYLLYNLDYLKNWNLTYPELKYNILHHKKYNIFHVLAFNTNNYFDCIDYNALNLNIQNWYVTCIIADWI